MTHVAIIGGGIGGLTAANALTRAGIEVAVYEAARERGLSNHLTSPWAAWRRDLKIAWRRRVNRRDPEGRGAAWLADYDASSPDVLAT